MSKQLVEWVHTFLLLSAFLFLVTGMGITEPNFINAITLRILTKETSYKIHTWLLYPFSVLLVIHIYLAIAPKLKKQEN